LVTAVTLLSPAWPVALAVPVVSVAEPILVTVLVLVDFSVTPEVPPILAAPVVMLPPPALLMVVNAFTPNPEAEPVFARALFSTTELTI
jgi:hypothetical protein